MPDPYPVSNTIKYSDGTETVVDYKPTENATEIEAEVADAIEGHEEVSDAVEAPAEEVNEDADESPLQSVEETEASEEVL